VENANAVQEAFKFTWPSPVLLMTMRLLNRVDRMVRLSLLVVALGCARLIRVTQLLLLLSCVEGHLLSQGVFVGDGKHMFQHPGVFHGELSD
jgi:hypothetical protein